jgi:ParB family chromosome partitioning protein
MCYEHKSIEISRINIVAQNFRITTKKNSDDLIKSIACLGIINPPVLVPRDDEFIVVCGFKRIEAARALNFSKIRASILPQETPKKQCIRLSIADNAFQRSLNIIEVSKSFALLQKYFSHSEIIKEADLLGLPSNPGYLKKIAPLCQMPESIQQAILADLISLPTAWQLSQMPEDPAIAFAKLLSALNCSLNKQREIITLIKEISHRDDVSVFDVLMDNSIQKIVHDDNLDTNQKTRQVRYELRRRRYPYITRAEKKFLSQIKKLGLSEKLRIIPPPGFEGDTYRLTIDFKSLDEIKAHQKTLDNLIADPEFISIF